MSKERYKELAGGLVSLLVAVGIIGSSAEENDHFIPVPYEQPKPGTPTDAAPTPRGEEKYPTATTIILNSYSTATFTPMRTYTPPDNPND